MKECPKELREIAYFSMERSILEYASTIWNPHLKKDILRIDHIQYNTINIVNIVLFYESADRKVIKSSNF